LRCLLDDGDHVAGYRPADAWLRHSVGRCRRITSDASTPCSRRQSSCAGIAVFSRSRLTSPSPPPRRSAFRERSPFRDAALFATLEGGAGSGHGPAVIVLNRKPPVGGTARCSLHVRPRARYG